MSFQITSKTALTFIFGQVYLDILQGLGNLQKVTKMWETYSKLTQLRLPLNHPTHHFLLLLLLILTNNPTPTTSNTSTSTTTNASSPTVISFSRKKSLSYDVYRRCSHLMAYQSLFFYLASSVAWLPWNMYVNNLFIQFQSRYLLSVRNYHQVQRWLEWLLLDLISMLFTSYWFLKKQITLTIIFLLGFPVVLSFIFLVAVMFSNCSHWTKNKYLILNYCNYYIFIFINIKNWKEKEQINSLDWPGKLYSYLSNNMCPLWVRSKDFFERMNFARCSSIPLFTDKQVCSVI